MVPGAIIMLLFVLVAAHFHKEHNPVKELAQKARLVDLVGRMRFGVSSASEAEKSAVMAITDKDSITFADQARRATEEVERQREELERLLKTNLKQNEADLFTQFSQAFTEFQRIDKDLLTLAVKNSNLKAYDLAYGPAHEAVGEMITALSHVVTTNGGAAEANKIMRLATVAEISALRIETLLAPHISEESNEKMNRMEASMSKEDERVLSALSGLKETPGLIDEADLAKARSSYGRFGEIRHKILALSRENTNVRSLEISLNEKRKITLLCEDTLKALKDAIEEEPVRGVTYGRPERPR